MFGWRIFRRTTFFLLSFRAERSAVEKSGPEPALRPYVDSLTVSSPSQMTWIFRSRKKNDRIDARQRVVLLRIKEVPPVHMPRREVRPWRVTIQHRRTVVNGITAVKNRIRAVLKAYGWAKEEENDSVITPNLLTGSNSQDFSTAARGAGLRSK